MSDEEKNIKIVLATTISIGSVTIAICAYFSWRWMAKQRGNLFIAHMYPEIFIGDKSLTISFVSGRKQKVLRLLFQKGEVYPEYPIETTLRGSANQIKLEELPLYSFQKVANATDNFHSDNKLGQGGFGPVYRVNACLLRHLGYSEPDKTDLMLIFRENCQMDKK